MSETANDTCIRCKGLGWYWRTPDGFNPFLAGGFQTARAMYKVNCNCSAVTPAPVSNVVGSEPAIIRLPWHKEPDGDFWRAEVIGHVYEVHDDDLADYKKRQCQYDFEARIRSVLVSPATTEGPDNGN